MTFIDRLMQTLERKKISQYKLCKDLGIGQSTISSWKKGKIPTADKIISLVQYLEVSADWLLGTEMQRLTLEEQNLLDAYRNAAPGIQQATRKLLDLPETADQKSESKLSHSKIG